MKFPSTPSSLTVGFLSSFMLLIQTSHACELDVSLVCQSSSGLSCEQLQQRTYGDCFETIFWEVVVTNLGSSSYVKINQLDLDLRHQGRTFEMHSSLPENPIAPGGATTMRPQRIINLCQSGSYSGSVTAAGSGPSSTCNAYSEVEFAIDVRHTYPALETPSSEGFNFVIEYPKPTDPNCQVFCAPGFTCSADGLSCFRADGPVPQPLPVAPPTQAILPVLPPVLPPVSPPVPAAPVPVPVMMPVPVPVMMPVPAPVLPPVPAVPAPVPVMMPVPVPVLQPPPVAVAPMPVQNPTASGPSAEVDCILVPQIECTRTDGSPCNTLTPRTDNCIEPVVYNVAISNAGTMPVDLTITVATLIVDGTPFNFLANLQNPTIAIGQSVSALVSATIDVCRNPAQVEFNANVSVQAAPPQGTICRQNPNPPPILPPPPAPVSQPMPVSQPSSTVVDCTVVPGLECLLSDGRSCSALQTRTTNCAETVRYVLSIENAGNIGLPIDEAGIIVNGNRINLLQDLSINPVPAGTTATASTTSVIDVCSGFSFDASIEFGVGELPMGFVCQQFIPQPTTIFVGGTPQPVSAPQAVPAPVQQPMNQIVDCILRSTLVSCVQANGSSCSNIVVPPDCSPVELIYNVQLDNDSVIELTVTQGNLVSGGQTIDFVPRLPSNPLASGQSDTVPVSVQVNVCDASNLSASVNVRGEPPLGFICR